MVAGKTAPDSLLGEPLFTREYQDGRSSAAMFALLLAAREFRRAGLPVEVFLFDLDDPMKASAKGRDTDMAERLHQAIVAAPESTFLVLTGNYHSRIVEGAPWDAKFQPMTKTLIAALAGSRPLSSLNLATTGGEAWICMGATPADCGLRKTGGKGGGTEWRIELGTGPAAEGHHGAYQIGPVTASPPATAGGKTDGP